MRASRKRVSQLDNFAKEAKAVRRRLHRQHRHNVRRALRRDADVPRWRRTSGWSTW